MALLRKEEVEAVAPPRREDELGALLGRGSRFEGKLSFEGTVRIEGEFVGDIISEGHLVVGDNARVEGTVSVGSASVSGFISGSVTTKKNLEVLKSARIRGDLIVEALTMERGAWFEGTVKMAGREPGDKSAPPSLSS